MVITAIILNYNKYKDTKECLLSLQIQKLPLSSALNVVVVDNASDDDSTYKLLKEFPEHKYIFNKTNLGFAKGVNKVINLNLEQSDYFLLVNNDAVLAWDCIYELIKESGGKAIAGPVIFYKDVPGKIWQGGGTFSKIRMNLTVPEKNKGLKSNVVENVDFVSGCVMLIPKSVLSKNGYFDEKFFFYGEDLDFCLRAKDRKVSALYVRKAKAWHSIGNIKSTRTNPFALENLAFSYILIIKKHYPKLKLYGLVLFFLIYTPFRLWQLLIGGNNLTNLKFWISGGIKAWKMKI